MATATTLPPVRTRRRTRLARGPITIGEPAPSIDVRLAPGDQYRPDTIADGGTACGLTVRAASVRGLAKRYLAVRVRTTCASASTSRPSR